MQSMQRQFGRFMKRSADDSQVAILLKDFDEADKLLGRIVDSTSAWRDAWSSLLSHQSRMLCEFEGLYAPIVGSETATIHTPVETPEKTMIRTNKLRDEYEELCKDLLEELNAVDQRMIQPASQAKESMMPLKKTIKKRDDRKLDYERYQGRVDSYAKKTKRSERDNVALSKAEGDLAKATEEYHTADENLRKCLPPLLAAVFSLLPNLLAAQIEIQNTMLAHYYTVILTYTEQEQFPSPPPSMEEIVQQWEHLFLPVQQEVESFGCLANGKTVRMSQGGDDHRNGGIASGRIPSGLNHFRRRSSGQSSSTPASTSAIHPATSPGRKVSIPSPMIDSKPPPVYESSKPRIPSSSTLSIPTPSSSHDAQTPAIAAAAASAARSDYFSRPHNPCGGSAAVSPGQNVLAAVAGKKKPPPPPPSRAGSKTLYVTALYDFEGEGPGDLAFREGDRIRVLEKTESTDDWWEGEIRGVKGSFPANYVQ